MKSSVFRQQAPDGAERFALMNNKMLRVRMNGELMARQGAMVAYQGQAEFDYQGTGSVGKFLKKAFTGEGLPLMRVRARGDVFFAHDANEIHIMTLENESLTVNGTNILAFDPSLQWDIQRVKGAGPAAGGWFNTTLSGSGQVAITAHGSPIVLNANVPTFVDTDSAIAWSGHLRPALRKSFKMGALIGRGSGEAFQLEFHGEGFVLVQASEGERLPAVK